LAGTTRDYLAALCDCDGLTVGLIDTAGEDAPKSSVEARAQALRAGQASAADLLLVCTPADAEQASVTPLPDRPSLRVRTKCDLASEGSEEPDSLRTSARTGEGLDALRSAIAAAIRSQPAEGDLPTTTGARCRESLALASESLANAAEALSAGLGDELVAIDLRQAVDELGKVVGAVVTDDILDRIFSRFCIGK
jgi:tRNA modification GTPase